ncbi:MAG: creatininase [Verrucomicrobia bacterium]|nr:creatininase [Verrucomicrobiota bacterium]
MPHPADPFGHALLAKRLAQIPGVLGGMLARGPAPLKPATLATTHFIITGTGSSEAHARYLTMLLNMYTPRAAAYLPLSGFTARQQPAFAGKTLVVFSQGVSPNAQLALRRRSGFAHTVLFTATTPGTALAAGKKDRAELLQQLLDEGGELVEFPLAEEYTTLIRFVGPMAGYLACLQFTAQLASCRFKIPPATDILRQLDARPSAELLDAMLHTPARFAAGFSLVTAAPISEFAQNLACKFMEGVFWPCPPISDFLQFAHGPFQQNTAHPHPIVILQGDAPLEAELVSRSLSMLRSVGLDAWVIRIDAPPLISIFGFEAALNQLVFTLMKQFGIDQINWPGKGRDDQLYGFCADV